MNAPFDFYSICAGPIYYNGSLSLSLTLTGPISSPIRHPPPGTHGKPIWNYNIHLFSYKDLCFASLVAVGSHVSHALRWQSITICLWQTVSHSTIESDRIRLFVAFEFWWEKHSWRFNQGDTIQTRSKSQIFITVGTIFSIYIHRNIAGIRSTPEEEDEGEEGRWKSYTKIQKSDIIFHMTMVNRGRMSYCRLVLDFSQSHIILWLSLSYRLKGLTPRLLFAAWISVISVFLFVLLVRCDAFAIDLNWRYCLVFQRLPAPLNGNWFSNFSQRIYD